jgi:CHAD domain-containing protein
MSKSRSGNRRVVRHRRSAPPSLMPVDVSVLLQSSLQERWATFVRQIRRARRYCSEPAIHDLRVATRRLIAMLDILAPLLPEGRARTVRRRLKRLLKSFNELRDVHVQRIAVRGVVRQYPVLRYYRTTLVAVERRLVREGARRIAACALESLSREVAGIQTDLQTVFAASGMSDAGEWLVRGAAAAAYRRGVQCRWQATPSNPRSLHRLRVTFKKFRYTLEILYPLMPWVGNDMLKAMNAYQTALGEIQDAEVFLNSVREFARSAIVALPTSWLPVTQELAHRRNMRIEEFMKQADRLYEFWPGGTGGAGSAQQPIIQRSGT